MALTLLVDHSIAPLQYALNFIWENPLILQFPWNQTPIMSAGIQPLAMSIMVLFYL